VKLSFEKSVPGRRALALGAPDVPPVDPAAALGPLAREGEPLLPELSELDVVRHYTALSRRNMGVDLAFYPLGSCTMKYNPKLGEAAARDRRFTGLHPYLPNALVQGTLRVLHETAAMLSEICGMADFTLLPAAGAHGELTGMMIVRAYHASRGDARRRVLVPDSSHGTNPASAALAGYEVETIPSNADGEVDLAALKKALNRDVAALMLTNPNTLGLFETQIREIGRAVHAKGALLYYDGANLNAIMGLARPGDMGFDVVHVNLHKTFATPHGGGGPGAGPVGAARRLVSFLPVPYVRRHGRKYALAWDRKKTIGRIIGFHGNVGVVLRAYAYLRALGAEGLRRASEHAVLNARYLLARLREEYPVPFDRPCMHEFVLSAEGTGARAIDIAKGLLDRGLHPPTVYFPLIVKEALMVEPTETESKETLDAAAEAFGEVARLARENPAEMCEAPRTTPVRRPDEVRAAREPDLAWRPQPRGPT